MRVRSDGAIMPEGKGTIREVLPKQGQLAAEDTAGMVLCKPKVLPLKSVSLEKLEQLQRAAMEAMEASRPPEGSAGSQPRP
ncbi:BBSome-interacting protein 1 [Coturnix japonica]|uniref:BBSome-interacting protein 1 n=1 Tax=Coturnix japonica TaxID=93934 RepID=UPI000778050D|nr:BBSome-interacting protein 1 [Coturnix japonica]